MKRHWLPVLALLLLGLPLYFSGLKDAGLRGTDELRYTKIADELEPGRNLFLLHFNGERYTDKPPLYFWMVAASHKLTGGLSPFAGRLPGVLSALLSGIFCYFIAFCLFRDRRLAFLSALTLIMMPRFIWIARWIRLDVPMAMFAYASMLCFVVNYFDAQRRLTGWLFWLCLALSFAIKGPAGPAVVLGGIVAFLLFSRQGRGIRELFDPVGIALFAMLTLAWVLPIVLLGESTASRDLIVEQNVGRILKPDRHVEAPWYYAENLWHDAFPAMLLLASAGIYAWVNRRREVATGTGEAGESAWDGRRAERRFLLCWAGFTLLMFSLYPPKRPQYLLPGYPAAAILAVHFLGVLQERLPSLGGDVLRKVRRFYRIPLWISLIPIAVVLFLLPWKDVLYPPVFELTKVFSQEAAMDLQERYAEFEYGDYTVGWLLRLATTAALVSVVLVFRSRLKRDRPLEAYGALLAAAWMVYLLLFGLAVKSSIDDADMRRYAQTFSEKLEKRPELRITVFGEDKPYYNVYGDFHVEYFDDDFEHEFRLYARKLYEGGYPMLVIIEADEMKEVRGEPWVEEMDRWEDSIGGDALVLMESPPGRPRELTSGS